MKTAVATQPELPAPICKFGYPHSQLEEIFSVLKLKAFFHWMRGQTFSSCDGRIFNAAENRMEASNCGPHGYVYYQSDVQRFVAGLPVID